MVPLTGPEIGWAVMLARLGREDMMYIEELFGRTNNAYMKINGIDPYEPPDDPRDPDAPTCAETNGANGDCPIGRTSCRGCNYQKGE